MKLKIALSWALELERKGRTRMVPAAVGMTDSVVLERVAVVVIASVVEAGGVAGAREEALWRERMGQWLSSAAKRSRH